MTTRALLVYPRFGADSFWSLTPVTRLCGVRHPEPPLGLLTLAALLPQDWEFRLVDRNVEALADGDLAWADLVMTGGMIAQRRDTLAVIDVCRGRGVPVVVGGPDPTSCEDLYQAADVLVLGEAEGILDQFVAAWARGERHGRFRAEKFTADVTQSPVPRFDLLRPGRYLYVGVQFSRGCPFNCEFCDIIELYGRVPRSKTTEQVLRELQAVYDMGHRGPVNFVDDNLIGNKRALKRFLPALARWQAERGHPFMFMTEASINLADDAELLGMMRNANFFLVFVGIETPDPATLVAIRKKQNTRRSLTESVHRIQRAGMFVIAGFIVGFDNERESVSQSLIECISETGIAACAIGLLAALPNTQLHRRLEREGRLNPPAPDNGEGDLFAATLNFRPLRPLRDVLVDYRDVLAAIYRPEAYFERVRQVGLRMRRQRDVLPATPGESVAPPPAPRRAGLTARVLERYGLNVYGFGGLITSNLRIFLRLLVLVTVRRPELARPFWRTLADVARHNPGALESTVIQMALFLHFGSFAARMVEALDERIAGLDRNGSPTKAAVRKRTVLADA